MKSKSLKVSRSTVYRTLSLLVEARASAHLWVVLAIWVELRQAGLIRRSFSVSGSWDEAWRNAHGEDQR
jgi:hypothetical protein